MALYETPLDLAQRHVAAGEERVARQQALIAALVQQGCDTVDAQALLATMEDALQILRERLDLEQKREAGRSPT